MKLTTILLNLDGTLLPMDNDAFTKGYFKLLAAKLSPHGYEPKQLVDAIWVGTAAGFELYTTYENIGYCKPNPEYYKELASRLGVSAEHCLMVGNDVTEDIIFLFYFNHSIADTDMSLNILSRLRCRL